MNVSWIGSNLIVSNDEAHNVFQRTIWTCCLKKLMMIKRMEEQICKKNSCFSKEIIKVLFPVGNFGFLVFFSWCGVSKITIPCAKLGQEKKLCLCKTNIGSIPKSRNPIFNNIVSTLPNRL
jgi:hypothetical protein